VVLDGYILTLDKTRYFQTLAERGHIDRVCAGRCAGEKADHQYRLLRSRRQWQSDRATEQRDELAPFQMIKLHLLP